MNPSSTDGLRLIQPGELETRGEGEGWVIEKQGKAVCLGMSCW